MEYSMSLTAPSRTTSYAVPKAFVPLTPAPRKLKHRCTCSAVAMLVFTYGLFIVVVTPSHHGSCKRAHSVGLTTLYLLSTFATVAVAN
jgi:hypothetical protein